MVNIGSRMRQQSSPLGDVIRWHDTQLHTAELTVEPLHSVEPSVGTYVLCMVHALHCYCLINFTHSRTGIL